MKDKLHKPLTKNGFYKISEEYNQLFEVDRPKMVQNMATAAAEGDRSENAEYIYSRKRIREIDKRLKYLSFLLKDADIVDPTNIMSDRVCFGATVTIVDEYEVEKTWTIVGVGEASVDEGSISWQSPLAKALNGKKVGDIVVFRRESGEIEYEVMDLKFGGRPWRTS